MTLVEEHNAEQIYPAEPEARSDDQISPDAPSFVLKVRPVGSYHLDGIVPLSVECSTDTS
jgi:hypothetical protein